MKTIKFRDCFQSLLHYKYYIIAYVILLSISIGYFIYEYSIEKAKKKYIVWLFFLFNLYKERYTERQLLLSFFNEVNFTLFIMFNSLNIKKATFYNKVNVSSNKKQQFLVLHYAFLSHTFAATNFVKQKIWKN